MDDMSCLSLSGRPSSSCFRTSRAACPALMTGMFSMGIVHHLRSGLPCIDLPERYGPRTTVFNRRRKAGVWDRLMDAIIAAGHQQKSHQANPQPKYPRRSINRYQARRKARAINHVPLRSTWLIAFNPKPNKPNQGHHRPF